MTISKKTNGTALTIALENDVISEVFEVTGFADVLTIV